MKHLLILLCLLSPFNPVKAFWPFSDDPTPLSEAKDKITVLESQLTTQADSLNRWQIATGSLIIGCVLLLVIGTALGATTRKHYDASSSARRLGRTPAPLNGRKPHLMGKTAEKNVHSTLAA